MIVGMIPARYNSLRFPGKLLHPILGKPLLQHTYERALSISLLDQLWILTDDTRIEQQARTFTDKVIRTGSADSGTERIAQVLKREFLDLPEESIVVNIQGDQPLVVPQTVEALIDALEKDGEAVLSTPLVLSCQRELLQAFSTVKCVRDRGGRALYFSRACIPWGAEEAYLHVGIYAYRLSFLRRYFSLPQSTLAESEDLEQLKILEGGYAISTPVVWQRPYDVNLPGDVPIVAKFLSSEVQSCSH